MRNSKRERKSSIEVTIIDREALMVDLFRQLEGSENVPPDVTGVDVLGRIGYVKTPRGIFVINDEGCSPDGDEDPITESHSTMLPLYLQYEREGQRSSSMFPEAEQKMDLEFIEKLKTKGTENLSIFIRTFGARLETNFDNWNSFLEEALK